MFVPLHGTSHSEKLLENSVPSGLQDCISNIHAASMECMNTGGNEAARAVLSVTQFIDAQYSEVGLATNIPVPDTKMIMPVSNRTAIICFSFWKPSG